MEGKVAKVVGRLDLQLVTLEIEQPYERPEGEDRETSD
jgi:hypothetical protein